MPKPKVTNELTDRVAGFKKELAELKLKYKVDFEIRKIEDHQLFIVETK